MKFSEKYFKGLTPQQHYLNNVWFIQTLNVRLAMFTQK